MSDSSQKDEKKDVSDIRDIDQDDHSRPGIPRPGEQPDQQQLPGAPPQPDARRHPASSQWIPPNVGNPDLDPVSQHGVGPSFGSGGNPQTNPLTPQGMLYDPNQLLDLQRRGNKPDSGVPPGARFDPFGPPDPSTIGPGRGPGPSAQFGVPDPDHFQPPGMPQPPSLGSGKSLKMPWPPGGRHGPGGLPPPGGSGGSPFL